METLLLSVAYVAGAGLVSLLALAMGLAFWPRLRADTLPDLAWELLLRYGLGISLLSALVIWLGLAGWMHPWLVWPLAGLLAVAGMFRAWRARSRNELTLDLPAVRAHLRLGWATLRPGERLLAAAVALWMLLLFVNILIGALAPDFGQDSLWYHLTIPGQWILTGRASTFPLCMPSNYPLAAEALYAALLQIGPEPLCSSLHAQISIGLFLGMAALTWRWAGGRAALFATASVAAFYATQNSIAPGSNGNDSVMAFLLLLAFGVLLDEGLRRSSIATKLAAGFLLGSAVATKLIALPFAGLIGIAWLAARAFRRPNPGAPLRLLRDPALVLAAAALAYFPWAIRGWLGPGNPVFPLLSGLFPVRDEYAPVMELSSRLNNVYPLSPAGFREALAAGLPEKLRFVSTMLDVGFGVILVAAAGLLAWKDRFWRLQGALMLAFYAVFFWMKGKNEVIRYFSLSYPVAAPAVGCFLDGIARRAGRNWIRYTLLGLLLLGGAFTYGKKQVQVASFRTIQWRFRPEVSGDAVLAFAHRAEGGETYLLFESIRDAIPPDAYVWIPEFRYPYYLKRRAWWCGFNDGWERMTEAEIRDLARREEFDYAILHLPLDPRVKPLADQGWLERIPNPNAESRGWSLWKVNPP